MTSAVGFDELLEAFPPEVAHLARRARELVLEALPDGVESCEGGDFGLGTSPGYKGLAFVITPLQDGIRLGIPHGAELDDPHGLLEGSGRVHRYVRIRSLEDLERPQLEDLVQRQARRVAQGPAYPSRPTNSR